MSDFSFATDGTTKLKLDILENMLLIKKSAMMIGDFSDRGSKLFTEKTTGGMNGCIGFVRDKSTKLNVPNTLLKKDIRNIITQPVYKIFTIMSKNFIDDKYSHIVRTDTDINLGECRFLEEVASLIDIKIS